MSFLECVFEQVAWMARSEMLLHAPAADSLIKAQVPCGGGLRRIRNRTLTVIDWDDTIFPTFEILKNGSTDPLDNLDLESRPDLKEEILRLEDSVLAFLRQAQGKGLVVVVTSSLSGWVEYSGSILLPRVIAFFRQNSIRIVSARTRYEASHATEEWKVLAFKDEVKYLFQRTEGVHIVIIGDGYSEVAGARFLHNKYDDMTVKMVKLVERPSIQQLMDELATLRKKIDAIYDYDMSFEVFL